MGMTKQGVSGSGTKISLEKGKKSTQYTWGLLEVADAIPELSEGKGVGTKNMDLATKVLYPSKEHMLSVQDSGLIWALKLKSFHQFYR